jgi:hypothetical protein
MSRKPILICLIKFATPVSRRCSNKYEKLDCRHQLKRILERGDLSLSFIDLFIGSRADGEKNIAWMKDELDKNGLKPIFETSGKIARYYRT